MEALPREARCLELLRQEIDQEEDAVGSLSDYLDRGRPSPAARAEAEANMARHRERSLALQAQFGAVLAAVRAQAPQQLEAWAAWHEQVLRRILAEGNAQEDFDQSVRLFVAQQTLAAWQRVRQGAAEVIYINWHYLRDYDREVRGAIGDRPSPACGRRAAG